MLRYNIPQEKPVVKAPAKKKPAKKKSGK